jgi:small subunit ribosomal protein S20
MAHSAQAKKRIRQSEKRRMRNKSRKSEIKTLTRKLLELAGQKNVEGAKKLFPQLVSKLDKAAKLNTYHRNKVARQKSKAARLIRDLQAQS